MRKSKVYRLAFFIRKIRNGGGEKCVKSGKKKN